nr:hypothetical protein [Microbacterium azadirachtae]
MIFLLLAGIVDGRLSGTASRGTRDADPDAVERRPCDLRDCSPHHILHALVRSADDIPEGTMTRNESDDATAIETWSLPIAWVGFSVFVLSVLVIAGVFFLVRTATGHVGPPLWFFLLWFGVAGWNVYWWLFRIAYRVELVGEMVRWRALFASGALPVSAITGAGRFFGTFSSCVLRAPGHRSLVVSTQRRPFEPMLAALNRLNPAVPPHL